MQRLVVSVLALSCVAMTCAPIAPPAPDACGDPVAGSVSALEIGPASFEGQPFVPWALTDTAYLSTGLQGGDMLGVSLRVSGDAPPSCLAQTTRLSFADEVIELDAPVHTYPDEAGGARVTRTLWLIFDQVPVAGEVVEVSTEAGGLSASSTLTIAGY